VQQLEHDWWTVKELQQAKEQVQETRQVKDHWADGCGAVLEVEKVKQTLQQALEAKA
jgi:hypothetical protein